MFVVFFFNDTATTEIYTLSLQTLFRSHGNGNQNGNQGGGNPADANNPGVSTGIEGSSGAVDSSGASRGYEGSTPDLGFNLGSPTGSHPDQNPANNPGIGYGIQDVDIDVDYGYYDGYATEVIGMKEPGATLSTQQMAHSVFDPGISLSTQQLGHPGATFSHNWDNPNTQFSPMESTPVDAWDNPNTQFSPMEFGPQHQMALSTQQLGQNVSVDARSVQEQAMNEAMAIGAQRANPNATTGVSPDSNPVGPTRSFQEQEMNEAMAIGRTRSPLGTPVDTFDADLANTTGATVSNRTAYQGPGKRGFAPPGYERQEDNTINITEKSVQSFVDFVQRNILSPREKEKAIRAFLDKHKMGLAELARDNAKNLDMGILGAIPGFGLLGNSRSLIMGLFELMGFFPQIDTPAMQVLK